LADIFDVVVTVKAETEKAILVTVNDEDEVWLPKSQIEYEKNRDGTTTVSAPTWLLRDKELI
jgi:hypothetical protein